MSIDVKKETLRSLLNRDFKSLKRDLINTAQAYSSGAFSDFNESSAGMALLEFAAFVGDGLNFYIDQQFAEAGANATEIRNIQENAKMRGYRPLGKRPSRGTVSIAIEIPATADLFGVVGPDDLYTPVLIKGSQVVGSNGTIFETLEDVHYTASLGRQVTGSLFDSLTSVPTHFAIRKDVEVVAGQTVEESFVVQEFQQFKQLALGQPDVIEIIDVFDSDGNEWFEVDYLAQDWVFVAQTNVNDDSDSVPYVMRLQTVPRRFIVDRDIVSSTTKLVFGSGDGVSYDDELVPNVAAYALPLAGRRTYNNFSIDPQNFLRTTSLGLSPHNTTIRVRYRIGGGSETNLPARAVKQVAAASFSFGSTGLDAIKKGRVEGSVGCTNLKSMQGGAPAETAREINSNAQASFAAQSRAVTREDVVARVLSLPQKFGKAEKVYVKTSNEARYSYDIHVLAKDADGHLALATPSLKANIATYLRKSKMLTDGVNILDGDILDLRCYFGVTVAQGKNRSEVISNCARMLGSYFHVDRMQIGQPIVLSDVIARLDEIAGVVSVYELTFTNVFGQTDGLSYSNSRLAIAESVKNGMLICPPESIFQIKYMNRDIVGSGR